MTLLRRYRKSFDLPIVIKKDYDLLWDYAGWMNMDAGFSPYSQKDWNQTLITKINQCSAHIHQKSSIGGATRLECGTNLEAIFDDLEYYNSDTKKLGGRYEVTFKKELQSTIRVFHDKRPDLTMIVKTKGIQEIYCSNNRRLLLTRR